MPVQNNMIPGSDFFFADRSFSLEEAESFFRRLKQEGKPSLHLVITWKSIEHEGPGIYDEAYLAYLRKILLTAETEGIGVFIHPFKGVWEKWLDGAPAWTLEKLGMDIDMIDKTETAVHTNATLFTLFFGGLTYSPDFYIDGENVQDWLQNRYIAAYLHAQRRLKKCTAIKGWEVLNEANNGFLEQKNFTDNFLKPFSDKYVNAIKDAQKR